MLSLLACNTIASGSTAESSDFTGTYGLVSIDGHQVPYAPVHQGRLAPKVVLGTLTLNRDGTFVSAMDYTLSSGDSMSRDFKGTYAGEGTDLTLKWEGAGQTRVTIEESTLSMNNEGMLFTYKK